MPPSNPPIKQDGYGQHVHRRFAMFYDQHKHPGLFPSGRPWWSYVEKQAGDRPISPKPVGELMPFGWSAPWTPPPSYINDSIGKAVLFGTSDDLHEARFRINYPRMIQEDSGEMQRYYDRVFEAMRDEKLKVIGYGEEVPYHVKRMIGYPPRSPKIAEAALGGNEWLLGFTPQEDRELARLLSSGHTHIPTISQAEEEQTENTTRLAQMERDMEELKKLLASLKPQKEKDQRPAKDPTKEPAGATA